MSQLNGNASFVQCTVVKIVTAYSYLCTFLQSLILLEIKQSVFIIITVHISVECKYVQLQSNTINDAS